MFGNAKDMMQQMAMIEKLMKDENFRAFIGHPKVKVLFADPEFQSALKANNPQDIMNHPKLSPLKDDPELAQILKKIDFKALLG